MRLPIPVLFLLITVAVVIAFGKPDNSSKRMTTSKKPIARKSTTSIPKAVKTTKKPRRHLDSSTTMSPLQLHLKKALGNIDLEKRRQALKNLGKVANKGNPTFKMDKKMSEALKKRAAKIAKASSKRASILKINKAAGLTDYLFEGDINMSTEHINELAKRLSNQPGRSKRQFAKYTNKWPNNTVYYSFDESLNAETIAGTQDAVDYLQSRTCIRFVENNTSPYRIRIFDGSGCSSSIGMTGGVQGLSLGSGCGYLATAVHELMHALGVWHTMSRSDRDDYIYVNETNILEGLGHNFAKQNDMLLVTPYEYGSVMHYPATSFSVASDKPTIIPKRMEYFETMGSDLITFYDMQMINKYYECKCETDLECSNGGYTNPSNCNECLCPDGYGGKLCDRRPDTCEDTLRAGCRWKEYSWNNTNPEETYSDTNTYRTCNVWIKAPPGKRIRVIIRSMSASVCTQGCIYNGIEIKTEPDQKIASPRFCCDDHVNRTLVSTSNLLPIMSYNLGDPTSYTIRYRYVNP